MQWLKTILYNASILSLFTEFQKKYPHPVIIYDNSAESMQEANTDIYQTLTEINSHWISRSLDYNHKYTNEVNSLHVFCVNMTSISTDLILDKILRSSNTFQIQNLIISHEHDSNAVSTNIFDKHERIQRNTVICERDLINIVCWRWINENVGEHKTLKDLLYEPINLNLLKIKIDVYIVAPKAFSACFSGRLIFTGLDAMISAEIMSAFNATPKYCTAKVVRQRKEDGCFMKDKINDEDALNLIKQLKTSQKTQFLHIYLHTVFDSKMIKYLFFENTKW